MPNLEQYKGQNLGGILRVILFPTTNVLSDDYSTFLATLSYTIESSAEGFSLTQSAQSGLYEIELNLSNNKLREENTTLFDQFQYLGFIAIVVDNNSEYWIFGKKEYPAVLRFSGATGESPRNLNGIRASLNCRGITPLTRYEYSDETTISGVTYSINPTTADEVDAEYRALVLWGIASGLGSDLVNLSVENLVNLLSQNLTAVAERSEGNYLVQNLVANLGAEAGQSLRFGISVTNVTGQTSPETFFTKAIDSIANVTITATVTKSNILKITWTDNSNGTTELISDRIIASLMNVSEGAEQNILVTLSEARRAEEVFIVTGAFGSVGDLAKIRYRIQRLDKTIGSTIAETANFVLGAAEIFTIDQTALHFTQATLTQTINIVSTESWEVIAPAFNGQFGLSVNAFSGSGNFALQVTSNLYGTILGTTLVLRNATGQIRTVTITADEFMQFSKTELIWKYNMTLLDRTLEVRSNRNWRVASTSDIFVSIFPTTGITGVTSAEIYTNPVDSGMPNTRNLIIEEDTATPTVSATLPVKLELFNVISNSISIQASAYRLNWSGNEGGAGDEVFGLATDRVVIVFKNLTTLVETTINEAGVLRNTLDLVRFQTLGTAGQTIEVKIKTLRTANGFESAVYTQNVIVLADDLLVDNTNDTITDNTNDTFILL